MPQKRSSLPASFRHGSLPTSMLHLSSRLPAWLIALNQAPPCLQASSMAHCPQACSTFPLLLQQSLKLFRWHRLIEIITLYVHYITCCQQQQILRSLFSVTLLKLLWGYTLPFAENLNQMTAVGKTGFLADIA